MEVERESDVVVEPTGTRVGRYKLLQQIGEGGFGVVYMAEQVEPVQRKVALKLIKAGMDTREVIARFEAERQALALMDHPNIAKVLDAGATEAGRPYFVMELVNGIPITHYCDQARLATVERLHLFMKVCHAVQHAHQKGIIHRDLKPSNVLVTLHDAEPVPKIIDFGVAKALGQKLTERTLYTAFQHMVGTPAYMSPEQAELSGLDVDTRSDIYSLGVLLYELLTGVTPFDKAMLSKAALDEIRRLIRETEPPKPSTRLQTLRERLPEIAERRHTHPAALTRLVRGDLDRIVMKCLEKDRRRRYETANTLALDVEHHLNHEPVTAAASSQLYRAGKFVRRHKAGLATATALFCLLLAGVVASIWQAVRATRAEKRALAEAAKSAQVAQFLKDMLEGVGPSVALGRDTTLLKEILNRTSDRLDKELRDQPGVEAELQNTLGGVYWALGEYAKAETALREVLAARRKLFGDEHREVAAALNDLGVTLEYQLKLPEAEATQRQALAMRRKVLREPHVDVAESFLTLASVLWREAKLTEAEARNREAVAMYQKLLGNQNELTAKSLNNLATVLADEGKLAEAEAVHRQALAAYRAVLPSEHPLVATSLNNLAFVLRSQGKAPEAQAMFRQVLAMLTKLLGNEHPDLATVRDNLAAVLDDQGKLAEAEVVQTEALDLRRKLAGNQPAAVARSATGLANILQHQGRSAEAEAFYQEALAIRRQFLASDDPSLALAQENLARLLRDQARPLEAEPLARECLGIREKRLPDHWRTCSARSLLGSVLLVEKKYAEAEPLLLSGYEGLNQHAAQIPAEAKAGLKEALQRLVQLYQETNRPDRAAEWKEKLAQLERPAS